MPPSRSRLQGFDRSLYHPGQRVCCALSGGADSTALLLALLEAQAERESLGVVLTAVHVHHGLRGADADADEEFVRSLCEAHGVPLTVERVDTPARQAAEREGVEEAARELRYGAFRAILATGQVDAVATAHTRDDQAETVLMKLLRGAWTDGISGIAPVLSGRGAELAAEPSPARGSTPSAGVVVRPMLEVSRAEVERFLRERDQPWRDDSTNADMSFTRNRVRHDLLPQLRRLNPALDATLARTAAIARDEERFWQGEVDRLLPGLILPGKPVRGGGRAVSTSAGERSVAVEVERLKAYPAALQRRLLRALAATLGCRIGADDTERLLGLAGLGGGSDPRPRNGARLDLGAGLKAERSLRELRLSRAGADIPKKM